MYDIYLCRMDQAMLNEVLGSVVSGRPIWKTSLHDCQPEPKNQEILKQHETVQKYIAWDSKCKVRLKLFLGLT